MPYQTKIFCTAVFFLLSISLAEAQMPVDPIPADPITTIHTATALQRPPGFGYVVPAPAFNKSAPTWTGIAVGENRVLAELIPTANIHEGLIAFFVTPIRRGRDSFLISHREMPAHIIKTDPKLGLVLLSASTPAGTKYPTEITDPIEGEAVRWIKIQENDWPREYQPATYSKDLLSKLSPGPLFDDTTHQLVGFSTRRPGYHSLKFVSAAELRQFIGSR